MELNFQPKKTEVVVSFRAANAPSFRHALHVERLGLLHVPKLERTLRCVPSYEYLGTIFAGRSDYAA